MLGITINHRNLAAAQADAYGFSGGMARIGRRVFGADASGLFVLGEESALAGGFAIAADLGRVCRLRFVWISGEFYGPMALILRADEGPELLHEWTPRHIDGRQHTHKVPVRRDQGHGRFWRIEVKNSTGADFSVDSISVLPVLAKGPR